MKYRLYYCRVTISFMLESVKLKLEKSLILNSTIVANSRMQRSWVQTDLFTVCYNCQMIFDTNHINVFGCTCLTLYWWICCSNWLELLRRVQRYSCSSYEMKLSKVSYSTHSSLYKQAARYTRRFARYTVANDTHAGISRSAIWYFSWNSFE